MSIVFMASYGSYINSLTNQKTSSKNIVNAANNMENDKEKTEKNPSKDVVEAEDLDVKSGKVQTEIYKLKHAFTTTELTTTSFSTETTTQATTTISDVLISTSATTVTELPEIIETTVHVTNPPVVTQAPSIGGTADLDYLNRCAFIGDSHINGLAGYGVVDSSRVFAKDGMFISQFSTYINLNSVAALNPEAIYIMLGTNGVSWIEHSKMVEDYSAILDSVHSSIPNARIYVLSIPPVSADIENKPSIADGQILNSQINSYNSMLCSMAMEKGFKYVDINSTLKNSEGKLENSFDGIHIPQSKYQDLKNFLLLSA